MASSWKVRTLVLCGLAFVVASVIGNANRVEARPTYLKEFAKKYDKVAEAAKAKKCGVCHPEKSKKVRNEYGKALGKHTGKNAKGAKIIEALDAAAKEKNADGKTYGEVIDSGKLP